MQVSGKLLLDSTTYFKTSVLLNQAQLILKYIFY